MRAGERRKKQLFLSLWWPNVCCNHCSSILSVDKGEGGQFWPPVNRNHSLLKCPMHWQCTANTLPLPKVSECIHWSVVQLSLALPWSGQHEGLTWPGLPLKSHLFCPLTVALWIAREKRIAIVDPNRRNPMLMGCHWKVICFVLGRNHQKSLSSTPRWL